MKAEELRIGNFIQSNGRILTVLGVKNEKVELERHAHWIDLATLKPIPLSEEVLLKCGFKNEIDEIDGKMYNIYFVANTDYFIEYFHSDKKYVFTDDMGLKVDIKHLHQLQNLYYALTGEELEVKWS